MEANTATDILFINGNNESYKTTILLHYAYSCIQHSQNKNSYILYVCKRSKIESTKMYFGRYKKFTVDYLKQIRIKYLDTYEELIKLLTSFHLYQEMPMCLIIDDIDVYTQLQMPNSKTKFALTLQLLNNITQYIELPPMKKENLNTFKCVVSANLYLEVKGTEKNPKLQKFKPNQNFNLIKHYVSTLINIIKDHESNYPSIYQLEYDESKLNIEHLDYREYLINNEIVNKIRENLNFQQIKVHDQ